METAQQQLASLGSAFDLQEAVKRAVKYLIEGLVVAVVAYYVPQKKMGLEEVAMVAFVAAATFALLDMFAPSISVAARQGAGFGIGANLVGFPAMR